MGDSTLPLPANGEVLSAFFKDPGTLLSTPEEPPMDGGVVVSEFALSVGLSVSVPTAVARGGEGPAFPAMGGPEPALSVDFGVSVLESGIPRVPGDPSEL
jgi:hypothetical protein